MAESRASTTTTSYAELAELAGGFIHEIKNHLSTLTLNLQLLGEDFQDPQTQRERRAFERVQRLETECDRLVDLANDFLRFARVENLCLAPTHLGPVVEELVDFFTPTARQANIDIKSYLPADLPAVQLDADLFKQALLNLMLNAEQAMPGGGELTLQAVEEDDSVVLSLIDTGKGMPAEVLARVFQPFFSTRAGGTGLGLPTVRRIVDAHGGAIDVQSEVGCGTKFTIRLRAASVCVAVRQPFQADSSAPDEGQAGKPDVLVAGSQAGKPDVRQADRNAGSQAGKPDVLTAEATP